MRPGQKNRMRGGRGNNNNGGRRGPNPLTRSYESNGPDVKVRGTPQHIAEKYVQLARDAHSSGDTVMAESYLQHAEHYYRIIAAAQHVQHAAYNQANGLPSPVSDDAMDDEDEFEVAGADRFTFRAPQSFQQPNAFNSQIGGIGGQQPGHAQAYAEPPGGGDQPVIGEPSGMEAAGQPGYQPRPPRGDRPFDNRRPFEDRGDRQGRNRDRRFGRDRAFGERAPGEPRGDEPRVGQERPQGFDRPQSEQPALGDRPRQDEEKPALPSFITAPVRNLAGEVADPPVLEAHADDDGAGRLRSRRRRRPRLEGVPDAGGDEPA